jgi:hypothetical protein
VASRTILGKGKGKAAGVEGRLFCSGPIVDASATYGLENWALDIPYSCILWRDKMYVPSACTIVRTMGRSAYSSKPNTQKKQLHSVSVKKTL